MKLSFIFPVYNGEKRMEKSVMEIMEKLDDIGYDYEIIIAEDGSTDKSAEIAARLASKYKKVIHLHSKKRLGKGLAVKNAMRKAKGKIVFFSDIDLSADPEAMKSFIKEIEKGAHICIGSRYMAASHTRRFIKRKAFSEVYIAFVKMLFGTGITDFQCGFKAFSRDALPIALSAKSNSWFWDTEVLLEAVRAGLKIKEIPISWTDFESTSVNVRKVAKEMFFSLFAYKMRRFWEALTGK